MAVRQGKDCRKQKKGHPVRWPKSWYPDRMTCPDQMDGVLLETVSTAAQDK